MQPVAVAEEEEEELVTLRYGVEPDAVQVEQIVCASEHRRGRQAECVVQWKVSRMKRAP